jgi:hypothetical protein
MGAQNKPFYTGRTILTQQGVEVNKFFLYFLGILLYNGRKSIHKENKRYETNYGRGLW